MRSLFPGGYSGGETPVPIPNTEVKPSSADGTSHVLCGRVGRRRDFINEPDPSKEGPGFFIPVLSKIRMKSRLDRRDFGNRVG